MPKPKGRGTERRQAIREVSVKPSNSANDKLIDRTITLWRTRLRRDLSREDAPQIAENVAGFFSILHEWFRANAPSPNNDNYVVGSTDEPEQPKGQGSDS
jgi:hypothetical protein